MTESSLSADSAHPTEQKHAGFVEVLRIASFRKLWAGQSISQFGDGFYWLAIMLGVSDLTGGDIQAIGLVSISFMVPQLPIGLFGGPLIDRVNRRHLMIVADILRIFTTLACILAYYWQSTALFYAFALIQASISGLFVPAKNALIPQLVENHQLLSANTLSQTTQIGAMIFGPALAGLTIEHMGIPIAFLIDAITFFISALFLLWMAPVPTVGGGETTLRAAWRDLLEGLRFVIHQPLVRHVILVVSVLFIGVGAVNVLWVPYMQQVFHAGAQYIGLVDAFQGVGMLAGALLMGYLTRFSPRSLLLTGLTVVSLAFIGIGAAPTYAIILAVTAILGTAIPPAQASFLTLIQQATPHTLMGRVNGAVGAATNGAMLLSMALATGFAARIGLRESYILCGIVGLIAVLLGLLVLREDTPAPSGASL